MEKTIRLVDELRGVVQVTTCGERWYAIPTTNEAGLPDYKYIPSVTWIAGSYPKGIAYFRWLAEKGWDESEAIKASAGAKGRNVHRATEILEAEGQLPINTVFQNEATGEQETLSPEELDGITSFARWHAENKPQALAIEKTVLGDFYAGTLDRIYRINGQIYIVDLKTSKQIWEEHKLQISAYSHAKIDYKSMGITDAEWADRKLAILQLGYCLNKNGFKFTEVEDKFEMFQIAHKIWLNENGDAKPKQKDYPLIIKLNQAKSAKGAKA